MKKKYSICVEKVLHKMVEVEAETEFDAVEKIRMAAAVDEIDFEDADEFSMTATPVYEDGEAGQEYAL